MQRIKLQARSTIDQEGSALFARRRVGSGHTSKTSSQSQAADVEATASRILSDTSDTQEASPTKTATVSISDSRKDDEKDEAKPKRPKIPPWVFLSWRDILFVFVPAGVVVNFTHRSPITVFAVNLIAIIPSTGLLSYAIDDITLRTGIILGGLLSQSFSNATQLISGILLLKNNQIDLLQSSILGVILSHLLLMIGLAFVAGGWNRMEQYFNVVLAQTLSYLLLLAVTSLLVPTAAHRLSNVSTENVLKQSRGISIITILSYAFWLFFQLKSHREFFTGPTESNRGREKSKRKPKKKNFLLEGRRSRVAASRSASREGSEDGAAAGAAADARSVDEEDESEMDRPQLNIWAAVLISIVCLAFLWLNTEYATNSIQEVLETVRISRLFVGLVILPLLSNDWSLLVVAVKDKMDIVLALTLEKCIQTSLLILPVLVLVGWGMDKPMTLVFNELVIVMTFASTTMVVWIVSDGKSNWLMGVLLVEVFIVIAVTAFFVSD